MQLADPELVARRAPKEATAEPMARSEPRPSDVTRVPAECISSKSLATSEVCTSNAPRDGIHGGPFTTVAVPWKTWKDCTRRLVQKRPNRGGDGSSQTRWHQCAANHNDKVFNRSMRTRCRPKLSTKMRSPVSNCFRLTRGSCAECIAVTLTASMAICGSAIEANDWCQTVSSPTADKVSCWYPPSENDDVTGVTLGPNYPNDVFVLSCRF